MRTGGFALITGEPGTGKSVALRLLAQRTERTEGLRVAALTHPSSRLADFYREMGELFAISLVHNNRWNGFKMLRERWRAHLDDTRMRPLPAHRRGTGTPAHRAHRDAPARLHRLRLARHLERRAVRRQTACSTNCAPRSCSRWPRASVSASSCSPPSPKTSHSSSTISSLRPATPLS